MSEIRITAERSGPPTIYGDDRAPGIVFVNFRDREPQSFGRFSGLTSWSREKIGDKVGCKLEGPWLIFEILSAEAGEVGMLYRVPVSAVLRIAERPKPPKGA